MFPIVAHIVVIAVLRKVIFYKIAQKSPIFWGYFWKQISCQELSKIAQPGHTSVTDNMSFKSIAMVLDSKVGV